MDLLTVLIALKYVFGILSAVFLCGFVFALAKGLRYRPRYSWTRRARRVFTLRDALLKERWERVARHIQYNVPESMKLGIIEADKVIDDVLKRLGVKGKDMGDRLRAMEGKGPVSVQGLWNAHRLRNDIVHTPGFALSPEQVRNALRDYEEFLKGIGVLE